jgi:hypothetical protein
METRSSKAFVGVLSGIARVWLLPFKQGRLSDAEWLRKTTLYAFVAPLVSYFFLHLLLTAFHPSLEIVLEHFIVDSFAFLVFAVTSSIALWIVKKGEAGSSVSSLSAFPLFLLLAGSLMSWGYFASFFTELYARSFMNRPIEVEWTLEREAFTAGVFLCSLFFSSAMLEVKIFPPLSSFPIPRLVVFLTLGLSLLFYFSYRFSNLVYIFSTSYS